MIYIKNVKELIEIAQAENSTEIYIAKGTYYLEKPIIIQNKSNLTIYADEKVRLVGGFPVQAKWEKVKNNIYKTFLKTTEKVDKLYIGGQEYWMARYPHKDSSIRILGGYKQDCQEFARQCKKPEGAYIHGLHAAMWGSLHYKITGQNESGDLLLTGGWQNNRNAPLHKEYQYVENLREALGAANEFYYDASQQQLYVYAETTPETDIEVITNPYLLQFRNCKNIRLSGITFAATARTFMEKYEKLLRSDWSIHRGASLLLDGGNNYEIHNCVFSQSGSNALFVNGNVSRANISSCHFKDLDASAICFVGLRDCVRDSSNDMEPHPLLDLEGVGPISDNYPRDCVVEDCLMHNFGKVEKQVAGVQISMSAHITIRHNTIYHCPRAAVNIGEGTFGGHIIEYCDFFDTVRESGDHGCFNGWGRDRFWNTPVELSPKELRNLAMRDAVYTSYIRFNRMRCDHGWDIDLDDGCSNYVIEGNLCLSGGIKLREGYHRIVRNNICVNDSVHMHVWYSESEDRIFGNILCAPYQPIHMPQQWGQLIDRNILHSPQIKKPQPANNLRKLSGQDEHSVLLNAEFANPQKGDYTVCNAQAAAVGFVQPPMGNYGVMSYHLRKKAESCPLPRLQETEYNQETLLWDIAGAVMRDITTDGEMSAFSVGGHNGAVVVQLPIMHSFDGAGIKKGELIEKVNGEPVKNCAHLMKLLDNKEGETLEISVKRAGGQGYITKVIL